MTLELRHFTEKEFAEYESWFQNAQIKKALGYIDQEWLNHILSDDKSDEWAVFSEELMVCVIGVALPAEDHPYYTVTNIAVKPELQRSGIAHAALTKILDHYNLASEISAWRSHVEIWNEAAINFFKNIGWQCDSKSESEIDKDMITFSWS